MEHLLEILRLIEAAVQGDRPKAVAYSRQLAQKQEQAGDTRAAERIRRALSAVSQTSVLPGATLTLDRLPVDTESRLALADETLVAREEIELFLAPHVERIVEEFVRYVSASERLIEDGVGVSPTMLIHGPPGCGKTELARMISAQLGLPLITARTDTLISSYLGSTAKNLRSLFDHASSRPCVLFLDEFDAIAKLRDDRYELGELKRVVVSLLQNIDAVRGHTVLLAATNHEHLLDPAIWRRFAYDLPIDLPEEDARRDMFLKFLNVNVEAKSLHRLVAVSRGLSGSDIRQICEDSRREAIVLGDGEPRFGDVMRRTLVRSLDGKDVPVPALIATAKDRFPSVCSHRVLADAFGMSPGNVTLILRRLREREGADARADEVTA